MRSASFLNTADFDNFARETRTNLDVAVGIGSQGSSQDQLTSVFFLLAVGLHRLLGFGDLNAESLDHFRADESKGVRPGGFNGVATVVIGILVVLLRGQFAHAGRRNHHHNQRQHDHAGDFQEVGNSQNHE